jgi:hypothetical protein
MDYYSRILNNITRLFSGSDDIYQMVDVHSFTDTMGNGNYTNDSINNVNTNSNYLMPHIYDVIEYDYEHINRVL